MKDFQLTDRVVVEVLDTKPEGKSCPTFIADQLRKIADKIEYECMKGDIETIQSIRENGIELKWEYECQAYGGFRMGDKSLIAMHYYGSEPKPITISAETFERVKKWKEDCDNTDTYTDGDMVDKAMPIFDAILEGGKS